MYYCCGFTDKGIMSHNEDAILIGQEISTEGSIENCMDAPFIIAVSDGVSGENAGEIASEMCLESLAETKAYNHDKINASILRVHNKLAEYSQDNAETSNMQATLCGFAVDKDNIVTAFNVGDSRLYRFRDGEIKQLSRDQSLVQLLYEEGQITKEQKKTHVHRNIIFPVLGNIKDIPKIDSFIIDGGFEFGDILILCTDGLSDYVSHFEMQEILELPKNLAIRVEMLVKKAIANGGSDNVSAIAVVMVYDE